MKKNLIVLLLSLVCSFLFVSRAKAQDHAYGYTGIDVDEASGVVRGYHRTEVDYNTEVYYTPSVCGSLSKDDVEQTRGCTDGLITATINTQFSYVAGSTYSALSDHYVRMEYEEEDPYNPGYYYFQDVLGYTFTNAGSQPIDWYYVASGIYYQRPDQSIRLGDTYVMISPEIFLKNAKLNELTSPFEGFSDYSQIATLRAGSSAHGNEICGDDPQQFTIIVNFKLPDNGQLVPSRCKATPVSIPDNKYNVGTATCVMDDSFFHLGHMSIPARRRCCGGPDDYPNIVFVIGANKAGQTGTIDTHGTVRVLCNE